MACQNSKNKRGGDATTRNNSASLLLLCLNKILGFNCWLLGQLIDDGSEAQQEQCIENERVRYRPSLCPHGPRFLPSKDLQCHFSVHDLLEANEYGVGEAKHRRSQTQIAGC